MPFFLTGIALFRLPTSSYILHMERHNLVVHLRSKCLLLLMILATDLIHYRGWRRCRRRRP